MFASINYKRIVIITLLTGLIQFVSYFGAFAHSDGGTGFIINLLYILFYILALPFYLTLLKLNITDSSILLGGLILDCLFYGFLIERILWKYKSLTSKN